MPLRVHVPPSFVSSALIVFYDSTTKLRLTMNCCWSVYPLKLTPWLLFRRIFFSYVANLSHICGLFFVQFIMSRGQFSSRFGGERLHLRPSLSSNLISSLTSVLVFPMGFFILNRDTFVVTFYSTFHHAQYVNHVFFLHCSAKRL